MDQSKGGQVAQREPRIQSIKGEMKEKKKEKHSFISFCSN